MGCGRVPVVRAKVVETTSLGAAYLADLGTSVAACLAGQGITATLWASAPQPAWCYSASSPWFDWCGALTASPAPETPTGQAGWLVMWWPRSEQPGYIYRA